MENSHVERTSSFSISPHRHLKSETYRTLVQILSHCYDHSQISAPQPTPEICELGELVWPSRTVPKISRAEKDTSVIKSFGAVCIQDRGFGDARMTIDDIVNIMDVEENDDLLKQKLMVGNNDEGTGNNDKVFDHQQRLMHELEHIVNGDKVSVQENGISFSSTLVGYNQSGVVDMMNDQEEHNDIRQVSEESRSEAKLQVDKGDCNLDILNSFDSVNRSMDSLVLKPFEDVEETSFSLRTNISEVENEIQQKVLEVENEMQRKEVEVENEMQPKEVEVENEMQRKEVEVENESQQKEMDVENEIRQKEMEVEKLDHTDDKIGACNYRAEDVEVEEGEISDSFEVDWVSTDMIFGDAVVSNEKKVSEDLIDKRDFSHNGQKGGTEIFYESTSFNLNAVDHTNSDRVVELKETVRDETQCKPNIVADKDAMMAIDADSYNFMPAARRNKRKASRDEEDIGSFSLCVDNSTDHGAIVEQSVTQKQIITSEGKPDSSVCNKKKRSAPSKEKRAKKKQKERKRCAEKNRQLGVKRLKLRPILKPKTVTYCRHYLKGRCQQGDKCKFSHDTVPLTKSTPCCHFARKLCMKGDDCPFDHDLSKYACTNLVARGFCNRHDDCLFSHKIPPKGDGPSTSSACIPQPKSPLLLPTSNSLKQPSIDLVSHRNVDVLSNHGEVFSSKNIEQNVPKSVLKPPAVVPKGINCLFLGKSSVVESSKLKQGSSSSKRNDSGKVTNQTEQNASGTIQNMDETPKRTLLPSKGINFLSFGNSPVENCSGKKLASLFLNRGSVAKLSPSNNFSVHDKAISSSYGENSAKGGNQPTQSAPSSVEKSNDMLKKTQPVVAPQALNFLSNGKALTNNSLSHKQASLIASSGNGINRSSQGSQTTDVHQNSIDIPWKLPTSPVASGHSFDHSVRGYHKSTPNSAQKALMSTLAFAAKIESERKINLSAVSTGVNSSASGSGIGSDGGRSGGSLNNSANVSKILEFLSGVGREMKQ